MVQVGSRVGRCFEQGKQPGHGRHRENKPVNLASNHRTLHFGRLQDRSCSHTRELPPGDGTGVAGSSLVVTVADCERVQTNWYRLRAQTCGGAVWTDGPLTWIDGPDGQNLMFPTTMTTAAVIRGVQRARDRGLPIVGAWLALGVDATPLARAGFTPGWSPWWMTADLSEPVGGSDPRVELQVETCDYEDEDPRYRQLLAVARRQPARAWYAAAYTARTGRFAGRAWSFLDGDLAGVFDMAVWEPFRRRGFGTGLLHAVCTAARRAGARHAVLNATPEGKHLYSSCGFTQIGEGITWWHHLGPD
jgi:GNAT superfamily N-acetyltransferase